MINAADFEHPVDSSEEARALGEANCTKWLPGFMRWAAPRMHDVEMLLIAANCDAFPCTLSGYDVIGNEAVNVPTPGLWPNLNGTNMPSFQFNYGYQGPGVNGQTYGWIWSETTQSCTVTVTGDNTSGANQTVNLKVLGTSSAASFVAPHNTSNGVLGSVTLTLQPGANYILMYSTGATSIYPHAVDFA